MSNYRLSIVESGSGDEYQAGIYGTLAECSEALEALECRYEGWCQSGFPPLPEDDLLKHYEGCDAYVTGPEGELYQETGYGGWEEF